MNAMNSMNSMNSMSADNVSPTYCPPDAFNGMRDSAILDGPMSNGLGISQADPQPHIITPNFSMPMGLAMQKQRSQHQHPVHQDTDGENRRTLTQAHFDAYASVDPFTISSSQDQSMPSVSATITNPADLYGQYDFPDLCDFNFDTANDEPLTAQPMQPSHSTDSYMSMAHSETMPSSSNTKQSHVPSARSDSSTPSVSITPARQDSDPFEYSLHNHSTQSVASQPVSAPQWQPGQSIPVDLAALQQEFQEAAMRNRTQSVPAVPHLPFLDQPYSMDEALRRDSSTTQLARSMQNFSMQAQRPGGPAASIAARRQRPKPAPLGTASMRSTSFGGGLPTSPTSVGASQKQSLRRIKSSQTMNGFSNGRIQKQRSPSGATFTDPSRLARRVSSFSPAFTGIPPLPNSSAGLAPPTPLSPTSYANMQRQASMSGEADEDVNHAISSTNFSPPTTPVYAAQFARGRLGSAAITENTPPQSAPATQQSFPTLNFSPASTMQSPMSSVPVLQSQPHGFVPMMSNEYPQMPNVVFPPQQQPMSGQYMEMPMSYIMTSTGEVHMGYQVIPPFAQQMHQQGTPPNSQHPFVPSSNSSPGTMVSSQVPKHSQPAADFFVHEYTPPQDVKQNPNTPRKATDSGPKNYTFSNHGPEYFERNVKKLPDGSSPTSSAEDSTAA